MASADAIKKIRRDVQSHLGKMVKLRANRGRKKTFEKEGVLEQVYPTYLS